MNPIALMHSRAASCEVRRSWDWLVIFYFLFLFFNTSFYFLDPTIYFPKFAQLGLSWLLLFCIALNTGVRWRWYLLLPFLYLMVAHLSKFSYQDDLSLMDLVYINNITHFTFITYFLGERTYVIERVIELFSKAFLWLNLPSIFIFLTVIVNLNLPYSLIHLGGRIKYYRNYFGIAIFNDYQIFNTGRFTLARLCGVFEEPGMLGTIDGMILIVFLILFPKRTKTIVLLVVLGLLTMSMAFYIALILMLFTVLLKKNIRLIFYLVPVILSIYMITPRDVIDVVDNVLFSRFELSDEGGFVGDTRRIEFKKQWEQYVATSSTRDLVFGHGAKSNQRDEQGQFSSYQGIIYEAGYLGFSMISGFILYIFVYLPLRHRRLDFLPLTAFPVLSIYQRPDPLLPYFIIAYAAVIVALTRSHSGQTPQAALSEALPV
jgi:hypothetical protein